MGSPPQKLLVPVGQLLPPLLIGSTTGWYKFVLVLVLAGTTSQLVEVLTGYSTTALVIGTNQSTRASTTTIVLVLY
jgi:hypothetical protein